jgi:hypothetical protein
MDLKEEGFTKLHLLPMGKMKRFLFHWRQGRKDHFPICCIFRFSIENALEDGKTLPVDKGQAGKRGSIRRDEMIFVPCNVFHRRSS